MVMNFNYFDEFCLILVNIEAHENNHFKGPSSLNNRISSKLYNLMVEYLPIDSPLLSFTIFQEFRINIWIRIYFLSHTLIWTELAVCSFTVYLKALLTGSHGQWLFHFSPGTSAVHARIHISGAKGILLISALEQNKCNSSSPPWNS